MRLLGQALTEQSATAKHVLGQLYTDPQTGKVYQYCVAGGSNLTQYHSVAIKPVTFVAAALTDALAQLGYEIGVTQIAVTANYYFWCLRRGAGSIVAASAAASEAAIWPTATAGVVDDATLSTACIRGLSLTATAGTGAATATTTCYLDFPRKAGR
jgi:hypothetical protein